jgi:hypothetical protein
MSYRPEKSTSDVIRDVILPIFAGGKFGEYNGTITESAANAAFEKSNVVLTSASEITDERSFIGFSSNFSV